MYMGSIVTSTAESEFVRELQGARVLLTGLTAATGVDIARGFARLKSKLIIHTNDLSPEVTEVVALVSQSAKETKLYTNSISDDDSAVRFAQVAAQAYGGLDAVINLSSISAEEAETIESEADIERLAIAKLSPMVHLTSVTANRMRLVLSEGHILNVVGVTGPMTRQASAAATFTRAALTAITQSEARRWADQGIRINAVGPEIVRGALADRGMAGANEANIAALAVYLTTRRGSSLSGHVFDENGDV